MGIFVCYLLCGIAGCVMGMADIKIKNWKYWVLLGCVIGSYFCGKYS